MLGEVKDSSQLIRERVIETYFRRDLKENKLYANAILVDMEPKVVQKCLLSKKKTSEDGIVWDYDQTQAFYKQGGSGNNWALGYKYYGQEEYEITQSLLQGQLERIDYFGGFSVLQSLAGGTGSGLGAHLVQKLRDDFPKANLLCTAVWPYFI